MFKHEFPGCSRKCESKLSQVACFRKFLLREKSVKTTNSPSHPHPNGAALPHPALAVPIAQQPDGPSLLCCDQSWREKESCANSVLWFTCGLPSISASEIVIVAHCIVAVLNVALLVSISASVLKTCRAQFCRSPDVNNVESWCFKLSASGLLLTWASHLYLSSAVCC